MSDNSFHISELLKAASNYPVEKGGPGSGRHLEHPFLGPKTRPVGHQKAVAMLRAKAREHEGKLGYKKPAFRGSTYLGRAKHEAAARTLHEWADKIEQNPSTSLDEFRKQLNGEKAQAERRAWSDMMSDVNNPFYDVKPYVHGVVEQAIGNGQAAQRVADREVTKGGPGSGRKPYSADYHNDAYKYHYGRFLDFIRDGDPSRKAVANLHGNAALLHLEAAEAVEAGDPRAAGDSLLARRASEKAEELEDMVTGSDRGYQPRYPDAG